MSDTTPVPPVDHCPACRVARELAEHRDLTAAGWSIRRGTLSFAIVLAERACPAYEPVRGGGGDE